MYEGMEGWDMKIEIDIHCFRAHKPEFGQPVIWIWRYCGIVTNGDYFKGKKRDSAKNYEVIKGIQPSHWMEWTKI